MRQEINLYLDFPKPAPYTLSALMAVKMCAVVMSILFVLTLYESIHYAIQSRRFVRLSNEQQLAFKELADATTRYPRISKEKQLEIEIEKLKQTITEQNLLLDTMRNPKLDETKGRFSRYMEALAHAIVQDVWLRTIQVNDGGKHINLVGSALAPTLVVQFAQNLQKEPVFLGKEFKTVALLLPPPKADVSEESSSEKESKKTDEESRSDSDKVVEKKQVNFILSTLSDVSADTKTLSPISSSQTVPK